MRWSSNKRYLFYVFIDKHLSGNSPEFLAFSEKVVKKSLLLLDEVESGVKVATKKTLLAFVIKRFARSDICRIKGSDVVANKFVTACEYDDDIIQTFLGE